MHACTSHTRVYLTGVHLMGVSHGRVPHGRVPHRRASHRPAPHGPAPLGLRLTGLHLISVHLIGLDLTSLDLIGVYLTGVHLKQACSPHRACVRVSDFENLEFFSFWENLPIPVVAAALYMLSTLKRRVKSAPSSRANSSRACRF
jgi:hypothetical protein